MKKVLLLLITLAGTGLSTYAQDRYVIFFTDKNNSPYSVSNPIQFLSQRAINRRTNQNITITQHDFPVNPSYIAGVAATGASILNTSRWFNSVTVNINDPSELAAILGLPYVYDWSHVGRQQGNTHQPSKFSEDQLRYRGPINYSSAKTTSFNYGYSFNQVNMLKGDVMHQNGYTGEGVMIAVLDAGFVNVDMMPAFDSLFANNRIVGTWDFVSNNSFVYDDHTHGTMVLSVMGGNVPGEIIGTAPHASYLLLRSEDAPTEYLIEEYNWASAAEFADSSGADIINSSLGYTLFDDPAHDHTYSDLDGSTTPITKAADFAASKGMVVCNSAGNEGGSPWFRISAPADADSILAVGAVDPSSAYVNFSGKGPSYDGRVKPNVAAQGSQTIVSDPWNGIGIFPANGTSFSSPLIAGMVATLWQCHPNATNMQIINAIQQSASQATNPDSLLGYGIPDFPVACLILAGLDPGNAQNGDLMSVNGNPFGDELNFSFYTNAPQTITVRLYDLLGKTVYKNEHRVIGLAKNEFVIPATFSRGIYILEVTSVNKLFAKKVMKR